MMPYKAEELDPKVCMVSSCGKMFSRRRSPSGVLEGKGAYRKRLYCSKDCADIAQAKNFPEAKRFCAYERCGKLLVRKRNKTRMEYRTSFMQRNYCDQKCHYLSQRTVLSVPRKFCVNCNERLTPKVAKRGYLESPRSVARRDFCDRECYKLWLDDNYGMDPQSILKDLKKERNWRVRNGNEDRF